MPSVPVGHVVDDLAEVVTPVVQRGGKVFAPKTVGQETARNDRQGRAHQQPRGGKDRAQRDNAQRDVARQGIARAQDQWRIFPPLVKRHHGRRRGRGSRQSP